jgi:hypothetical protein
MHQLVKTMQDAGLVLYRQFDMPNMDVYSAVFTDRCMLKNRKIHCISIAISGLEELNGAWRHRAEYALEQYKFEMRKFGGFVRADIAL